MVDVSGVGVGSVVGGVVLAVVVYAGEGDGGRGLR